MADSLLLFQLLKTKQHVGADPTNLGRKAEPTVRIRDAPSTKIILVAGKEFMMQANR